MFEKILCVHLVFETQLRYSAIYFLKAYQAYSETYLNFE